MKKYPFIIPLLIFLGCFFFTSKTYAAIVLVNTSSTVENGSGTSVSSSTINTSVTSGNLEVVNCRYYAGGSAVTSTVTDSLGNTYTLAAKSQIPTDSNLSSFYTISSGTSGADAITCHYGVNSKYWTINTLQYSGIAATNPLDVATTSTATAQANVTSTQFTTSQANEVIVGIFSDNGNQPAFVASTNYTVEGGVVGDDTGMEDRIVSVLQTNQVAGMKDTEGGTQNWAVNVMSFKAAPFAVQMATSTYGSSVTNITAAFPSNTTAGNAIIVCVRYSGNSSLTALGDSGGNTYHNISSSTTGNTSNDGVLSMYYSANIAGGADTISATTSPASNMQIGAAEVSGLATSSPLDQFHFQNSTNNGGTLATFGSGLTATTTQASEYLVGCGTSVAANGNAWSAVSPFTIRTNSGMSRMIYEDNNIALTGKYSASSTQSGANSWVGGIATFELAGAGAGGGGGTTSTVTWTGGGADNNWTTVGNWSSGAVPGSTSTVIFSASSTKNATINATVNVAGLNINTGYTGTITQGSGENVTVGTSSFSQAVGTFQTVGGTTVTVNGLWSQTGGTFNGSSSTELYANGGISVTGGTFNSTNNTLIASTTITLSSSFVPGTGIFTLGSTSSTITGSSTFYVLDIPKDFNNDGINVATATITIATNTILTVQNRLDVIMDNFRLNLFGGGQINVQGNIGDASHEGGIAGGTVSIDLTGTSTQTIGLYLSQYDPSGSGPAWGDVETDLPNLTIATSSQAVLENYIGIGAEDPTSKALTATWNNSSSYAINPTTSTVGFFGGPWEGYDTTYGDATSAVASVTGSSTFYNLYFFPSDFGITTTSTIATGTVLTVENNFQLGAYGGPVYLPGGGTVNIQGNVLGGGNEMSFGGATFNGPLAGTVSFVLDGTSTQAIDVIDPLGVTNPGMAAVFPNLTVNKPSGYAYVATYPSNGYDSLWINGPLNVTEGELRLSAPTSSATTTVTEVDGAVTVGSGGVLSDYGAASSSLLLGGGQTLSNSGLIYFDGSGGGCSSTLPNYDIINGHETGDAQPPSGTTSWTGSGTTVMRYTQVGYQGGTTNIADVNGTSLGNNSSTYWTFPTAARPQLVQSATASGGSGTNNVSTTLTYWPRAGDLIVVAVSAKNQSITTPTDSAGNTYYLAASSTFGSSPSYALSIYYASNASTTYSSPFFITVNGTSSAGSQFLSIGAYEYAGLVSTSTFDTSISHQDTSGLGTSVTSLSTSGSTANELYFGAATLGASTTASSSASWTSRSGITNNSTRQSLYVEDQGATSSISTAATWTGAASTTYNDILAIFKPPFSSAYVASGTLDSATYDTGVASGTQLNSVIWQGSENHSTFVGFQFAVSNSSNGPWTFLGPDDTSATCDETSTHCFTGSAGKAIKLVGINSTGGYTFLNGYRYFRYRIYLFADPSNSYTPTVTGVTVNWSP